MPCHAMPCICHATRPSRQASPFQPPPPLSPLDDCIGDHLFFLQFSFCPPLPSPRFQRRRGEKGWKGKGKDKDKDKDKGSIEENKGKQRNQGREGKVKPGEVRGVFPSRKLPIPMPTIPMCLTRQRNEVLTRCDGSFDVSGKQEAISAAPCHSMPCHATRRRGCWVGGV